MKLIHPATVIVCGGTGSGKTELTKKLLLFRDQVFDNMPTPAKVTWCYGAVKPDLRSVRANGLNLSFHEGLVDEDFIKDTRPDIIVVDDLMNEIGQSSLVTDLFTKFSHHLNLTVIFITQNLYAKGQVTVKRNAHYIFLTRNPSDKTQITTMASQLFPRRKQALEHFFESFDDATREKYGYLLVDVSPHGDENYKLRTNIFPEPDGKTRTIVYQMKNSARISGSSH